MTIGIATRGPNAGRAALSALAAVEAVGRGAIGGFVSMAAIAHDGVLVRAQTQQNGSEGLVHTGIDDEELLLSAPLAVLMSSSPNRPEPLSQFTPGDSTVGLITGHRLPNVPGENGLPLNQSVLEHMRTGMPVSHAVKLVIQANPRADAGVIGLSIDGEFEFANTQRVNQRTDLGAASRLSENKQAGAAVVHNSILPVSPLAELVTAIALDVMQPPDLPDRHVMLHTGTPVHIGNEEAVVVDGNGTVVAVVLIDTDFHGGRWDTGIGDRSPVYSGQKRIGYLIEEPYLIIENSIVQLADGLPSRRLGMRMI